MIRLLFLLFFFNFSYGQNYEYTEVFLRDFKGDFIEVIKKGIVDVIGDEIRLFEQKLDVVSKRFIFDEKGVSAGIMYSCTDGVFWYTVLITKENTLYFKKNEEEMFRIKLKKKI
jgi:hypothetical protein